MRIGDRHADRLITIRILITYPYRNNLSAYAAGFVGLEGRHARNGLATVPLSVSGPGYGAEGGGKTRPARAARCHFRYKTRPAHSKCPVLARFSCAGRTLYHCGQQQAKQGELCTAYEVDTKPVDTTTHQAPLVWRTPEGPEGTASVPVGGGRTRAGTSATQYRRRRRCVGRRRDRRHGRASRRGAERVRSPSLAGGQTLRRPEHQRRQAAQQQAPHERTQANNNRHP